MTKEIIIDGINLTELKAKSAALQAEQNALRASIQQGASKFVSDNIEAALVAVKAMRDAESPELARAEAAIAFEHLNDAKFVAEVAAISYSLPYSGNDYTYGDSGDFGTISSVIDDDENGNLEYDWRNAEDPIHKLASLAEDMEDTVREWNTSYC
jgi:hypothetical protein